MAFSVDMKPKRRPREEMFDDLRTITRLALNGAAYRVHEDEMAIRLVNHHGSLSLPSGCSRAATTGRRFWPRHRI